MTDNSDRDPAEEALLEEIFRHAEPRPRPADAARERAFAALHGQWSRSLARRRRRRLLAGAAASAAVAAIGAALWFLPPAPEVSAVAATIERASGQGLVLNGEFVAAERAVSATPALKAGDRLATQAGSRLAIRWGNGSLRLDDATHIEISSGHGLRLEAGKLYFDSTPWGRGQGEPGRIVIDTRLGRIAHFGTQFQAGLRDGQLEVGVREGEVRIEDDGADVRVGKGEVVRRASGGRVERADLAPHAASWSWAAEIAPYQDFAGRTGREVLAWVAHEKGLSVNFLSDRARALAASEARGIDSLAPDAALRTLPVMTSLEISVSDGVIAVDAAPGDSEP